jgi:hypothetical protein
MPLYRVSETRYFAANVSAPDHGTAVTAFEKIADAEKLVDRVGPTTNVLMDDASAAAVMKEIVTDLKTNEAAPSGKMVIDYLNKKIEQIENPIVIVEVPFDEQV